MNVMFIHAFAEKVALIPDGTNPIGRAVALQLALQGAYVIVGDHGGSVVETDALEESKNLGSIAVTSVSDLSAGEGARQIITEVNDSFGRLNLLVNSLKFKAKSSFLESSEADFSASLDRNLRSGYFITQFAVELIMSGQNPGLSMSFQPATGRKRLEM
ncbi:MAG: SDR family oxidoreductase [Blastocatellia bacterium]